jgi:hypothetical protein
MESTAAGTKSIATTRKPASTQAEIVLTGLSSFLRAAQGRLERLNTRWEDTVPFEEPEEE